MDPTLHSVARVINGTNAVTVVIDISGMVEGDYIYIKRYNNGDASGTITVQTQAPGLNFIQDTAGAFQSSLTLPTTAGSRQLGWYFDGAHLELFSN